MQPLLPPVQQGDGTTLGLKRIHRGPHAFTPAQRRQPTVHVLLSRAVPLFRLLVPPGFSASSLRAGTIPRPSSLSGKRAQMLVASPLIRAMPPLKATRDTLLAALLARRLPPPSSP
mmetsp:Transcript_2092/g.3990  ORF Transcript_2092/g.3990 Transcript_2092/m.3990 type:complete len:116 (+) Transcript_2092:375-722(+)